MGFQSAEFKIRCTLKKRNSQVLFTTISRNVPLATKNMAPPKGSTRNPNWFKAGGGSESPNTPSLAENLSYSMIPKPFKDEKNKKGPRRNKTLKQILAAERLRAKQVSDSLMKSNAPEDDVEMASAIDDQSVSNDQAQQLPQSASSRKSKKEALPLFNPDVNYNAYIVIEAPPSLIPPKKYCDITGLEAPYVDPKTRLRYHNAEVYELIKTFGPGLDQIYLSLRGAHITLR
ncbi:hypothetical protein O181_009168 [Austropuccinia psidii MF-1]|uniref:Vps72/YL1 C-terminal domain-containing protein n=1 Tax=Austropuccinia psidii MF-1 TaxID=1389203 RepID=A0A9Q3BQU5_9BASI|nr:hypothetical protein [Austropuccinia psidii MF-1]